MNRKRKHLAAAAVACTDNSDINSDINNNNHHRHRHHQQIEHTVIGTWYVKSNRRQLVRILKEAIPERSATCEVNNTQDHDERLGVFSSSKLEKWSSLRGLGLSYENVSDTPAVSFDQCKGSILRFCKLRDTLAARFHR